MKEKLMRKTKKELIEIINEKTKGSIKSTEGETCDIFIVMKKDGNEVIHHIEPRNWTMNTDLQDLGKVLYSFEWELVTQHLMEGTSLIDKRCKRPEKIIASIIKNMEDRK